jgi:hypothetical protein
VSPSHHSRSVRDQSRIIAHTAHNPALVSPDGRQVVPEGEPASPDHARLSMACVADVRCPRHTRNDALLPATCRRNMTSLVGTRHVISEAVMSRRTRTLIGIVVIELLLAGGWIWLHGMALTSPHATSDSTRVIGEVFGGTRGLLLALSPLLYFLARSNDRRAASGCK